MTVELETPRLRLRTFTPEDAGDYLDYMSDPELLRNLGMFPVTDLAAAEQVIDWMLAERVPVALEERASGRVIGHIVLHPPALELGDVPALREKRGASLSFALHRDRRGRGLMREALAALIDWLFSQGYDFINCGFFAFNTASAALQRSLGFQFYAAGEHMGVRTVENILYRDR